MIASSIIDLLAEKHHKDVFVRECKDGPTWNSGHLRLDGWAMRKSWANPCMWGYEVKVSRSDWLGDQKVQLYAPYCNQLYVVATQGVVKHEELPEGVGLMLVNSGGTGLLTKRKAVHRDITPPVDLLLYILMNRVVVCRKWYGTTEGTDKVQKWKDWLAEKNENREVGHEVSRTLRDKYERDVEAVDRENKRLKQETERLERVRQALDHMGVRYSTWDQPEEVARRAAERMKCIPGELIQSLHRTARQIADTLEQLEVKGAEDTAR